MKLGIILPFTILLHLVLWAQTGIPNPQPESLAHERQNPQASAYVLTIGSDPAGAALYLNDQALNAVTPLTIDTLKAGTYVITARKDSWFADRMITLTAPDTYHVSLQLRPETSVLRVFTDPLGAGLLINGVEVGQTPFYHPVVSWDEPIPIKLQKNGYWTIDDTISKGSSPFVGVSYVMAQYGTISLEDPGQTSILINHVNSDSIPHVRSTDLKRIVFEPLHLGDYTVWVSRTHYEMFVMDFTLTPEMPSIHITPQLKRKEGIVVFPSYPFPFMVDVRNKESRLFRYRSGAGSPLDISLPYGAYDIAVRGGGYRPYRERISLYSPLPHTMEVDLRWPNRGFAAISSLILPGTGQIYSQQFRKGLFMAGSVSISLGLFGILQGVYERERSDYDRYQNRFEQAVSTEEMERFNSKLHSSRRRLERYRIMMAGLNVAAGSAYLWNIIDITFRFPVEPSASGTTFHTE